MFNVNNSTDCTSCSEGSVPHECPKAQRACGHHCNCIWTQDACHWCGATIDSEGEITIPQLSRRRYNHVNKA